MPADEVIIGHLRERTFCDLHVCEVYFQKHKQGCKMWQRTTRAVACSRAAGCWLWNMSQSGCTSAAMNTELPAFMATCVVCEAGSRGQKSSLDLASAVSVILQ